MIDILNKTVNELKTTVVYGIDAQLMCVVTGTIYGWLFDTNYEQLIYVKCDDSYRISKVVASECFDNEADAVAALKLKLGV